MGQAMADNEILANSLTKMINVWKPLGTLSKNEHNKNIIKNVAVKRSPQQVKSAMSDPKVPGPMGPGVPRVPHFACVTKH